MASRTIHPMPRLRHLAARGYLLPCEAVGSPESNQEGEAGQGSEDSNAPGGAWARLVRLLTGR